MICKEEWLVLIKMIKKHNVMIIQIINNKIINKIMHFNNKKHKIEDKDNNNNKVHLVL